MLIKHPHKLKLIHYYQGVLFLIILEHFCIRFYLQLQIHLV